MMLLGCAFFCLALVFVGKMWIKETCMQIENYRKRHLEELEENLAENHLFLSIHRLQRVWFVALSMMIVTSLFSFNPWLILISTLLLFAPALVLKFIAVRRKKTFLSQFGKSLPQIVSILRSGHSIERALTLLSETQIPPLQQELRLLLKETRLGQSLELALDRLQRRYPHPDMKAFVRAVLISRKVGSNLAEAIDRVGEMNRARKALHDRVHALTAQGRAQAVIALIMPFALGLAIEMISPGYLNPLFETQTGERILMGSGIFLILGAFSIYRICQTEMMS